MMFLLYQQYKDHHMQEKPRKAIINALLTVIKVEKLSHSFLRLHFSCDKPLMVNPRWICPHLKLLFADPLTDEITFPQLDENNKIMVSDRIRQLARSYSIRGYDESTNQLIIDFAIHSHGLATGWAQKAKVGDQVGIVGTAGKLEFDNQFLVLMGDISAVPTICYTVENLPSSQKALAFIEVNHKTDIVELPINKNVTIQWFVKDVNAPNQLIEAVMNIDLSDQENILFWGGMERSLAQQLRHSIKDKYLNLEPNAIQITSYWREGFAEGEFKHRD